MIDWHSHILPAVDDGSRDVKESIALLNLLNEQGVDTVILGCTHFPLLSPVLSDILGSGVTLINSGAACAERCEQLLREQEALCDPSQQGDCRFYVSDQPGGFVDVAEMFLGRAVESDIQRVDPEEME